MALSFRSKIIKKRQQHALNDMLLAPWWVPNGKIYILPFGPMRTHGDIYAIKLGFTIVKKSRIKLKYIVMDETQIVRAFLSIICRK